ncbi:MAG: hypothetical protein COB46_08895 [Rhodospirillaceae bacterium]|nr:MAG: hypothetical protein COB46_08895 [Rhodospirillaceae bacterium]
MAKQHIFGKERDFLNEIQKSGEDKPDYGVLVKEYKKLLKQSERLVRISDRQQLELIALNEMKNKFVGMAAHDLRNPAALVNGFSDVLLSDPDMDGEERAELLGIIHEVSESMLKLLGDLLDVSAIESGKLSLEPASGRLDQMVEKRVGLLRNIADQKNISITLDCVPTTAVFDTDRLAQVVDNLVGNAIKFSESNTEITVSVSSTPQHTFIKVADQGLGIPAAEIDKVFGTFERLSVKPTGGEKSHGLGMAIVKKIVTAHKGQVSLESTVGKGTTFTVQLPAL